jgi:type I site-specific restriction-modification system R (restriction) subunit
MIKQDFVQFNRSLLNQYKIKMLEIKNYQKITVKNITQMHRYYRYHQLLKKPQGQMFHSAGSLLHYTRNDNDANYTRSWKLKIL